MVEKEVLLVDKGQPKFLDVFPKTPQAMRVIVGERINMAVALSEFAVMHKGTKLQDFNLSYVNGNVFEGMPEEKFIAKLNPIQFFSDTVKKLKKENSGIEDLKIDSKNDVTTFSVTLKEPDWDLEELIYSKYHQLLKQYKNQAFDIIIDQQLK